MNGFRLSYREGLESIYIDFAKQALDENWIEKQLKLVDEVGQFKEKDRFSSQDLSIKNLNSLVSTANKQLSGIPGCVFLKVPYMLLRFCSRGQKLVAKVLFQYKWSKDSCAKKNFLEGIGVRVDREETFIVNENAKLQLSEISKTILAQPMMFKKYV